MKKIKQTSDIVKHILETQPDTRNSDDLLYSKVCEHINRDCISYPFYFVITNRKQFGIPPFESVRRSRQKLQSAYPHLAGNAEVGAGRIENEEIMKNYARRFTV